MSVLKMVLALLGGLGLFLYGMNLMSSHLEAVAGSRMKKLIDKLTTNRFLGVAVGFLITAVIQSSSATTVMVVGFVNCRLMNLKQATWVIMGANIGTTVTGLLIAMDIGLVAPLIAFLGVLLLVFFKNRMVRHIGSIVAGLGILFMGMGMMGDAMAPLRDNPGFVDVMTKFSNPILGILAGMAFTAIIQSSSASVGILQALAISGAIGLDSAVYVLFGQNIGTCITALIASFGANRNAKRTTVVHITFNVIGTLIFTLICMFTPFVSWIQGWFPSAPAAQIAVTHTIFNVTTTLLLLPVGGWLARFATLILPDAKQRPTAIDKWFDEITASRHVLGSTAVALDSLDRDIAGMFALARENVEAGFDALMTARTDGLDAFEKREERIDRYNYEISLKITKLSSAELGAADAATLSSYFRVIGNVERIGDHAMNLAGYAALALEKGFAFSDESRREMAAMKEACLAALNLLLSARDGNEDVLAAVERYEESNDRAVDTAREALLRRVHEGGESADTAVLYSEYLSDYERIGDHLLNIAQEYDARHKNEPAASLAATPAQA